MASHENTPHSKKGFVSAGLGHSAVVLESGDLMSWGLSRQCQLGVDYLTEKDAKKGKELPPPEDRHTPDVVKALKASGDKVTAPVRETAAQALSVLLRAMGGGAAAQAAEALLTMQARDVWEVRHGAMLGLKYLLAVRADLLPSLLPRAAPTVTSSRRTDDRRPCVTTAAAASASSPPRARSSTARLHDPSAVSSSWVKSAAARCGSPSVDDVRSPTYSAGRSSARLRDVPAFLAATRA